MKDLVRSHKMMCLLFSPCFQTSVRVMCFGNLVAILVGIRTVQQNNSHPEWDSTLAVLILGFKKYHHDKLL